MYYEKYKVRMKRFKMDLGECIHGLNLLCGVNLDESEKIFWKFCYYKCAKLLCAVTVIPTPIVKQESWRNMRHATWKQY